MNARIVRTALAAIMAASGTAFAAALPFIDGDQGAALPWHVFVWGLAAIAWMGVWAWWRERPLLTVAGAWAALALNLWLWSLAVIPLVFALFASVRAIARAMRPRAPSA